jgi:ATP-dependent RNA helicase SUPV3L1/SUV3
MERTEGAIAEEAGPEMEVFYTFRWVPKKRPSNQGRSQRPQAKVKKLPRGSKPKLHTPKLAPTKDKPLDPDNPFAALMALKGKS